MEQVETDQALAVFCKFKGKCTNCGKFGHKSTECHLRVENSKQEGSNSKGDKSKKATDKSKINCFSCGKMGHYHLKCPKSKLKKGTAKQSEKGEIILMMIKGDKWPHEDIWIVDSAALTHIVNSKVGLFDVKNVHKPIKIGDSKLVYATKVGQLKVFYTNYVGESQEFVLENIQFIPGFWVNLFSLMAAMSKGCLISNEEQMIVVSKNLLQLKFNEEIKTKNSFVCGIVLPIMPATDCMLAMVATVMTRITQG